MHKTIRLGALAVVTLAMAGAAWAETKKGVSAAGAAAVCPVDDAKKLEAVLAFLHAGNMNEIQHAKLALDRAQSPEVKQFAERMIKDHTDADKRLSALASKKGISLDPKPPIDPIHAAVEKVDAKMMKALEEKSGPSFDGAYMGPELMEHVVTLAVIEEGKSAAKDGEVKALLDEMHKSVSEHRMHAAQIVDKMKLAMPGAAPTTKGKGIGGGPTK